MQGVVAGLAALFAVAGLGKALRPAEIRETVTAILGPRRHLASALAALVIAAELVASMLLIVATAAGLVLAVVLLAVFAAVAFSQRDRGLACACFAASASAPLGRWTVVRNALLIVAAITALATSGALELSTEVLVAGLAMAAIFVLADALHAAHAAAVSLEMPSATGATR